jgi:hypothetical protein
MILELQQEMALSCRYASEVEKINKMLKTMATQNHQEVIAFFKRYEKKFSTNSSMLMKVSFIIRVLERDVTAH